MTSEELNQFQQQLLRLRDRITGEVTHLQGEALRASGGEATGSLSNTPLHMADLGSDNFEQEFTLTLMQNEQQTLEEIAGALDRFHQGRFGRCEECHQEIPRPRLQALPYTRYCVECARKLQQSE